VQHCLVGSEMCIRDREYVLTYYSSKPDCEQDYIQLGKERYPLIRQSPNEFEYTEIMEVERDG
jgi:DNA sulfur modification protein DndD